MIPVRSPTDPELPQIGSTGNHQIIKEMIMVTQIVLSIEYGHANKINGKFLGSNRELFPDYAVIEESEVYNIFPIYGGVLGELRETGIGPDYIQNGYDNGPNDCYYQVKVLRAWFKEQAELILRSLTEADEPSVQKSEDKIEKSTTTVNSASE